MLLLPKVIFILASLTSIFFRFHNFVYFFQLFLGSHHHHTGLHCSGAPPSDKSPLSDSSGPGVTGGEFQKVTKHSIDMFTKKEARILFNVQSNPVANSIPMSHLLNFSSCSYSCACGFNNVYGKWGSLNSLCKENEDCDSIIIKSCSCSFHTTTIKCNPCLQGWCTKNGENYPWPITGEIGEVHFPTALFFYE